MVQILNTNKCWKCKLAILYAEIWFDIAYLLTAVGCHPVAAVQYTFTHKQYTEQHNETEYTERYIT
jgi:hypothetical protein